MAGLGCDACSPDEIAGPVLNATSVITASAIILGLLRPARTHDLEWEQQAQNLLAQFRADYARYPGDALFNQLIEDLRKDSAQFGAWWEQHEVRGLPDGPRRMQYPGLGRLDFEHVTFQTSLTPDLRVKVYTASPETARKLLKAIELGKAVGSEA